MNKTDKRLDELEKRLDRIENGLEEMGIMTICKYCKRALEVDIEKHYLDRGSESEVRGWFCNKNCFELFVEDWSGDKSGKAFKEV